MMVHVLLHFILSHDCVIQLVTLCHTSVTCNFVSYSLAKSEKEKEKTKL